MKKTIVDIANYIVSRFSKEKNPISHIKLQKLLFYCSGALLVHGTDQIKSLITDFEAWEYGPVSREVYNEFKKFKAQKIIFEEAKNSSISNFYNEDIRIIESILDIYGGFGAWALVNQTHSEKIWKDAYKGDGKIRKKEMTDYFYKLFIENGVSLPKALYSGTFYIDDLPVLDISKKDIFSLSEFIKKNRELPKSLIK